MINLEVKGTLAKLLATEDLIVEHKSVETAFFNVKSRVLTLPIWEKASSDVYDLLIAHEVGHALYTPNEDWTERLNCPKVYLNVTEDARIENLMKRRFGGLPKTFYIGYKQLFEDDFFEMGDRDPNEMGAADRANLYFKVGGFLNIKFSPEEQVVIDQIAAAETFDDAIAAADALYALCQKQKEDSPEKAPEHLDEEDYPQENQNNEQGEDGEESPEEPQEPQEEGQGEPQESQADGEQEELEGEDKPLPENAGGERGADDKLETVDGLEQKLKDLAVKGMFNEPNYLEYPKIDLDHVVISSQEISDHVRGIWSRHMEGISEARSKEAALSWYQSALQTHFDNYAQFKREIQSEVNYMVKEFECKKSATAYARASTSRTGILDCTKLHTYKYNEDLFKKVTNLPEGKNHGLVFILDWSGSMCHILKDTVKQLLSLVMFCDKVNIPFDVYAFTNEWNDYDYDERKKVTEGGKFFISSHFTLLNFLTSRVSRKDLHRDMEMLFSLASMFDGYNHGFVPAKVSLSGTPLNESLMCLHQILPEFQKRANVEKAHCMILTDGESLGTMYTKEVTYQGETSYVTSRVDSSSYERKFYIRNRKTGTIRKVGTNLTTSLLDDLRETFPNSSFTGFRVMERSASWYVRQASNYNEKKLAEWKKEKQIALEGFGYTKYYLVSCTNLSADAEFDVDDDASKAKIKSAFAKSLKSKKNNKKILGDFVGLIA